MYFLYMIKNKEGHLYIGITDNPKRRLEEHNKNRGALFTKHSSIFSMVFLEPQQTLTEARKREIQIKKWSRIKKENLIDLYNKKIETKQ